MSATHDSGLGLASRIGEQVRDFDKLSPDGSLVHASKASTGSARTVGECIRQRWVSAFANEWVGPFTDEVVGNDKGLVLPFLC